MGSTGVSGKERRCCHHHHGHCEEAVPDDALPRVPRRGGLAALTAASTLLGGGVQQALAEAQAQVPLDLRVAGAQLSPLEPSGLGVPVGWEIYFGFLAGLSPFVIAAYEFGKRILIQRACAVCEGSGLVTKGRFKRKCPACGGFLPWESWEMFLFSEAGNGGVVRFPKGQKSVFFNVKDATAESQKMRALLEQDDTVAAAAAAQETEPVKSNTELRK